jgi:hypothetical protein
VRRVGILAPDLPAARPLVTALGERGIDAQVLVPAALRMNPGERRSDLGVVVNLVDDRADAATRAFATEYLAYLADIEVPAVNGLDALVVGTSLARRLALLAYLGVAHPPARVVASPAGVAAALADLGHPARHTVDDGPPVVVQVVPPTGDPVRIDYVAGRQHAATAAGAPVTVDLAIGKLGAAVVQTGQLEFAGVTFAVDEDTHLPVCLGVDTHLPAAPRALDALADHVLLRAGLTAPAGA